MRFEKKNKKMVAKAFFINMTKKVLFFVFTKCLINFFVTFMKNIFLTIYIKKDKTHMMSITVFVGCKY